jgi:hypothetical protein
MTSDANLSLENEQLEEYLEKVPPAPPVVVVQYRNRGIPSWVFVSLILVVPTSAIVIYHRMVIDKYRVETAEARRVLESLTDAPRASVPAGTEEKRVSVTLDSTPAPPVVSSQPVTAAPSQSGPSQPVLDAA